MLVSEIVSLDVSPVMILWQFAVWNSTSTTVLLLVLLCLRKSSCKFLSLSKLLLASNSLSAICLSKCTGAARSQAWLRRTKNAILVYRSCQEPGLAPVNRKSAISVFRSCQEPGLAPDKNKIRYFGSPELPGARPGSS